MTEPKPDTPLAPTRFIHPGADITDGATGKPYSQAGEKSAGELRYEKHCAAGRADLDRWPTWESLNTKQQGKWEWNATVMPKAQTIKAP